MNKQLINSYNNFRNEFNKYVKRMAFSHHTSIEHEIDVANDQLNNQI